MFVKKLDGQFVHCPNCDSTDVRYSDGFRLQDLWYWLLRRHGLRCRACRHRFYERTDEAKSSMWVR